MNSLDNKVPPPLVAVVCAAAMWYLTSHTPLLDLPRIPLLIAAVVVAVFGVIIALAGIISFRLASTTTDPLNPEAATTLVTGGMYRYTRNPMYLGVLLVLVGWAVYLSSPVALVGVLAYWLYIQRFQIRPEERAMAALFGRAYTEYTASVRRWL